MDQLIAMRAFVRVVEAGTFSSAARTLNVGTPTITRLVQALEHHLQVRLLQRTTRSMTLTSEGESYYGRVVRLLAELADVESSTRHSAEMPSGRLRVECSAAIATMVLLPALPEFRQSYPDLEVQLRLGNRRADLVAEGIDCAIRVGEINEQFLIARRIGQCRDITCATPRFLAAHGVPDSPDDVPAWRTIRMFSARTGQAAAFRFTTEAGPIEVSPSRSLLINDPHAYLAAGLAGLGIIQAPAYLVREALTSGRLVAVLEHWRPAGHPVYLTYPPGRFPSATLRVFNDWVVEVFKSHADLRPAERPPLIQ
jgi:DNA-binding transcriptional LysR family regulator